MESSFVVRACTAPRMAARAGSTEGVGFRVRDCSLSSAAGGGAAGKVAPRGITSVGDGAEGEAGATASPSVSMAADSESLSSLGREGVVRSRTLRFFRFLVERDPVRGEGLGRDLGVRATKVRAWDSRWARSSWQRILISCRY